MIRLTRCAQADKAGTYFRLHLATGDNQAQPASPSPSLRACWMGPALAAVGLVQSNMPNAKELVRLCRGLHPTQRVRLAPAINRKRAYYDVTITAPKTVSVAALLNPNHPTAHSIMYVHVRAVEEVLSAVATMLQPQSGSAPRVATWLGALFHHTHSREGDPHLHSHLIFPNVMRNTKGQWRAMQVNIAGLNRTHLSLIYAQALTRSLQRFGFLREELFIQRGKAPELRALLPLVPRFSQATRAVLAAAKAAEAEHLHGSAQPAAGKHAGRTHPRSGMPVPKSDLALKRRRRLADQLRRPKPKDADDPVKLGEEASRWHKALTNQEVRTLLQLLDNLDVTNPRRRMPVATKPPPAVAAIVQAAFRDVCTLYQRDPTEALLLRSAVAYSAGRHSYEELQKGCRTRLEKHWVAHAEMWARIRADFVAAEEAEFARGISGQTTSGPQPAPTPPATRPSTNPAPTPTSRGTHR